MSLNLDDSFKAVTRHGEYYIPGGDLSFQVEHIVFRVHRYFFERESPFFRARLSNPASPGAQPQGAVDSNAIVLEDVTPENFATFLWVFYNPRYSLYDATVESWSAILHLANKWQFLEVKSLAIRELEQKIIPEVPRIKLYHDNDVDKNFLIQRYAALCERDEPLTYEEGLELGIQTALMIAAGRERVREALSPTGVRSPLTPTVRGSDLHGVIRQLFNIEATDTSSSSVTEDVPPKQSADTTSAAGDESVEGENNPDDKQKGQGSKGSEPAIKIDVKTASDKLRNGGENTPITPGASGSGGSSNNKQNKKGGRRTQG